MAFTVNDVEIIFAPEDRAYGEVSQKAQELAAAERGGAEDTAKGNVINLSPSFQSVKKRA